MVWPMAIVVKVLLIYAVWSRSAHALIHPAADLNFIERSMKDGYNAEEHTVLTNDSYILTMFHMQGRGKCLEETRPPLLLMPGLFMNSDTWLDAGPKSGLAYLLSDAGFNLWVGNVRGSFYGKKHVYLDPETEPNFWDFSADEIGMYDVPAMIDYVLQYTGFDKLDYIGYSQGSGVVLNMCSERPDHCSKLRTFIALAPATQLIHTKSKVLRVGFTLMDILDRTLGELSFKEVLPKGGVIQTLLSNICEYDSLQDIVCIPLLSAIDSYHAGSIKPETWKILYKNLPSGASVRTLARYGQALWSRGYRKFDYGKRRNLQLYGVPFAPYYNISAAIVPSVVIYGRNDYLVDPKDIDWLTSSLPNLLEKKEVEDPVWNHVDFMYSQYIKEMVYPTILKYLSRRDDNNNK